MSVAQRTIPKVQGRTIIADLPPKLAKRAVLVQKQKERRTKEYVRAAEHGKAKQARREATTQYGLIRQQIRNERAWRREDLVMGPLAPKRDVGPQHETFGAMTVHTLFGKEKMKPKDYGIVVGDRAVIVQEGHRDLGKIGRVKEVRKEAEQCVLEGLNVVDVAVPEYMLMKEEDKTKVRPYEKAIDLSSVRLVAPLPDPATGNLKDVVINELKFKKLTERERKGQDPPTRFVSGLSPPTIIPYPEAAEVEEDEHEDDTLRIQVEERTWLPTLHMPPMPPAVLDELRNKFSKFRIRHDEAYIQKAVKEQEEKEGQKLAKARLMMTPLKERRRKERLERKALGKPMLDEQTLAQIGEVMERSMGGTAGYLKEMPSVYPPDNVTSSHEYVRA